MSEQTPAPAGAENTNPGAAPVEQGDPADKPLGPNGEKALKAEREARAAAEKAAADLQSKLDEIAKANLSELERAQQEAKEAQAAAAKATVEALRFRLAATHGISTTPAEDGGPSDAEMFLTASDEAGMSKQAARLAASLRTGAAPRTPAPDPTQAGKGSPMALNSDGLERALRDKLGIA